MSEFQVLGELVKLVGFPGAICLLMIYLNKRQREECRQDAKEDRDMYIAERDRLYKQIGEMNERNATIYEKVANALEHFKNGKNGT